MSVQATPVAQGMSEQSRPEYPSAQVHVLSVPHVPCLLHILGQCAEHWCMYDNDKMSIRNVLDTRFMVWRCE